MTLYDSSLLIDYLAGDDDAAASVEARVGERAVAPPLVLFEVYQGEVFKSGPAEFAAVDGALEWLDVVESTRAVARAAAELRADLRRRGTPLAPRDAFVAGAAVEYGERLAVSDADFDIPGLAERLDVALV